MYRRVCYYTNWAQYRTRPGRFVPEDVPVELCTHLIFAFATMSGNDLKAFEWNDESTDWMDGMYERFTGLKKRNPRLVTILGVGGWNFGTSKMTKMLQSASNRAEFTKHSIKFLRKWNFDGLDLDFEYPAARGSPPEDKWRFSKLVQEMANGYTKESMVTGKPRLLLTAAVAAGKFKIDAGYDVAFISKYLDFINIMTYDFHGKWEKKTGHNCPLYAHRDETGDEAYLNLEYAASYWVTQGALPSKLNIGLPLYARSFTLRDKSKNSLGAPAKSGGKAGKYTQEEGYLSFYEVCTFVKKGAQVFWIEDQQVPYAVIGDQWVGFDDENSLKLKTRWIKDHGFGGVMVWALDLDDKTGSCGGPTFPLLRAINEELGVNTHISNEIIRAPSPTPTPTPVPT
ncbi:hypothetical protein CAPTEDRAFT_205081 [Capitella teleta]|uniref:GH18 domain-containing protein n=1 Tax=Capitella teleta TaxID=283909 RepID=R7TGU2_CAPTE|nr:hypothetical protein CAPTEDRAFT_205081 [Capitella teleta]|eukprot:ELT90300.1 hypothetical protein CAPTEDRAFT_205081 [Capitella teleta]